MDLKLPTLDVKIWVREGRIEFDFFEKTMSINTVLHAKTAQSDSTKFASLSQEVVRRLLHTKIGFDRYGHTDTDTDMVIPIYIKPIPIPILPSRIYIKPIPIPISVLKFISNRYR